MTAQEYNHVFLPQINRAEEFVELFESSIEHMSDTRVDKDDVRKQFQIRGWSEETRQVILTALEYYKCAEGLAKIPLELTTLSEITGLQCLRPKFGRRWSLSC